MPVVARSIPLVVVGNVIAGVVVDERYSWREFTRKGNAPLVNAIDLLGVTKKFPKGGAAFPALRVAWIIDPDADQQVRRSQ